MPVGDDVVDLRHPQCQPDAIHSRFDSRVFLASERMILANAGSIHRMRWSLWAAKESAYKAARQLDRTLRFIPAEFEVRLDGDRAEVMHRTGQFRVWFDHSDSWVHAVAGRTGPRPEFRVGGDVHATIDLGEQDAGDRVRKLACSAMSTALNCSVEDVRIVSVDRIPHLEMRGEPVPFAISMSHDGRFVSCAWAREKGTDLFTQRK